MNLRLMGTLYLRQSTFMRLAALPLRRLCGQYRRSLSTFAERDIVLLRQKSNHEAVILTKPLKPGVRIQTHKGDISHSDIIGKCPRDLITTTAGHDYRIHHVTLAEYVNLSRRIVTPIYPADANLIVSLFDLHPSIGQDAEKLEILEAGTGHGALTLHLSRAIHGSNPSKPQPSPEIQDVSEPEGKAVDAHQDVDSGAENTGDNEAMAAWKSARRAVVHTVEISSKHSKHAVKVVAGFRHGLYADNVDFHVGDVSEWVKTEFSRRDPTSHEPFLSHVFLDLPATHDHLAAVASALKTDGVLIVFNPSITQIAECVQKIKRQGIPLFLDQTVELGNNGTSGGRPWDVRAVKPRAAKKAQSTNDILDSGQSSDSDASENKDQSLTRDPGQALAEADPEDANWTLVCRPKVGDRVVGGGFLGVFRKMRDNSST